MRHLPTLLILLILAGCAPSGVIEQQTIQTTYDFRPFSERGFLFTVDPYVGDFESVGLVSVTVRPGVRVDDSRRAELRPGEYRDGNVIIHPPSTQGAIEQLYRQARDLGANAITHVKVDHIPVEESVGYGAFTSQAVVAPGVRVSGFAIRRTSP